LPLEIRKKQLELGNLRLILLGLFISATNLALSQEIVVKGGFVEDSISIGEEVHFWLRAEYPPNIQLIFPDTNYTFAPYEFLDKSFTETSLLNNLAKDSAVYSLQSFEIDPVQFLKLSAIVLTEQDSLELESNTDSIYFRELAPVVSDTTQLKTNLEFQTVNRQFNFPLLWIIMGALVIVAVILVLVFGNRVRKYFRIKRMRKEYQTFVITLTDQIQTLKGEPRPDVAESALNNWKQYLERLESVPYTKLTSKEILAQDKNAELQDTLKEIDKTVYGKIEQQEIYKHFQEIEDFTQHRYSLALEEVKNG